jgi:hypothetical protein
MLERGMSGPRHRDRRTTAIAIVHLSRSEPRVDQTRQNCRHRSAVGHRPFREFGQRCRFAILQRTQDEELRRAHSRRHLCLPRRTPKRAKDTTNGIDGGRDV